VKVKIRATLSLSLMKRMETYQKLIELVHYVYIILVRKLSILMTKWKIMILFGIIDELLHSRLASIVTCGTVVGLCGGIAFGFGGANLIPVVPVHLR
jgi:hypothetical protein